MTPLKILIVDDEKHMRRLIDLSLRKGGYSILEAQNGAEAVEAAKRELPALIVMDLNMPEMDGLAALQRIRTCPETAKIPVIMLTARGQSFTREQVQQSGASLYLTKPFSPSQLLAEIRQLLSRSDASSP